MNLIWIKIKVWTDILFNPMLCSCGWYLDHKNCRNLIAACIITKREPDEDMSFFKKKRKKKQVVDQWNKESFEKKIKILIYPNI